MKGQFFLATAFALALIFFMGLYSQLSPEVILFPRTDPMVTFFDNVKSEYPRAANLGLNESSVVSTLSNFTQFIQGKAREKGSSLHLIYVLTENVSDDLNVTVGNFLGQTMNVTLNISGDSQTIEVSDGGIGSNLFSNTSESFTLEINFNTTERNLLLEMRKTNLYFILELRKGDSVIKDEVKS